MKKYIITDNKEKFIQDDLNESYEMEYVVWVLDGDDNQWKKYKGSHTDEIDKDAFLKSINYKVYPNFDIASNFIDVKVLPAGKSPMDESCGKTTDGKTIEGEFSEDGKTFTDKDGNEYPVNDGGEIIEESWYKRTDDENDYTEIDTGLNDDKAKDVIRAVMGQLSDGMWENSPRMEQYWHNLDVDGGKIRFYRHAWNSQRHRWENPFWGMSEQELKNWFITKIKQIVRAEGLKWNKNNDQVSQYLDYNSGVTVADAYRVCDAIKNGKVTKYAYDENKLDESVVNFDKYEYDLGGYANELGEQLSEFLSKADTLVDDSVISEDELKLLMDASDLLKEIQEYI